VTILGCHFVKHDQRILGIEDYLHDIIKIDEHMFYINKLLQNIIKYKILSNISLNGILDGTRGMGP
jgi:hypothetical protein